MRSPKDIAAAIRQAQTPKEEPELFLNAPLEEEDDLFSDLDPVEAPAEPIDYKKRVGAILRSTRRARKEGDE